MTYQCRVVRRIAALQAKPTRTLRSRNGSLNAGEYPTTLDTGGVWSIARGLTHNVKAYKQRLANADLPRCNDLDGRGHLSEEALADFTRFVLKTCLDRATFIEELVQPDKLRARIKLWVDEKIALGRLYESPA